MCSTEQVREVFETKVRGVTPLAVSLRNGHFEYYTDPHTQSVWVGFLIGYKAASRSCEAHKAMDDTMLGATGPR